MPSFQLFNKSCVNGRALLDHWFIDDASRFKFCIPTGPRQGWLHLELRCSSFNGRIRDPGLRLLGMSRNWPVATG
uniref:Uncharacterized protein n=1 Tax=Globodera rostochiensis TaxID=31243 RepID=A0A914I4M3_GLORO